MILYIYFYFKNLLRKIVYEIDLSIYMYVVLKQLDVNLKYKV